MKKVLLKRCFLVYDERIKAINHLPKSLLGGYGEGVIPEPIPNSEVKPFIADGTAYKNVGE
jgi:hypothetical protein